MSITPNSGEPEVGNFSFVNFVIMSEKGEALASLNYTTIDNDWNILHTETEFTMSPHTQWTIQFETRASCGARRGIVAEIQMTLHID